MRPANNNNAAPSGRSGCKPSIGRSLAILAFPLLLLAACDEDGGQGSHSNLALSGSQPVSRMASLTLSTGAKVPMTEAAMDGMASQSSDTDDFAEQRTLAYRHETDARAEVSAVAGVISGIAAYCQELPGCLVLEQMSRQVEGYATGSFTARALPEDIPTLEEALGRQDGDLVIEARVTTAEDMAGPIADMERRLSMLRQQRAQLERLQERAGDSIDHLIRIGQQLSQVQSNIEAIEGQRERVRKQVERELWTLRVTSRPTAAGAVRPIYEALKDVPGNFSSAVALLIVFLAYTLPWAVVFVPALWGLRVWLRKRSERKAAARKSFLAQSIGKPSRS